MSYELYQYLRGDDTMSEWITDREPKKSDADDERRVWTMFRDKPTQVEYWHVERGRPWMPIVPPEPYVKHQYRVGTWAGNMYGVYQDSSDHVVAAHILTKEAAERIAAIYEEVAP